MLSSFGTVCKAGKWVRWRESTYLSNPRLKRGYFKKAMRAAMAIEKGTHGFRGDGSRAFDIGHRNFAWKRRPVLAMERLDDSLASTRYDTGEFKVVMDCKSFMGRK